MVNVQVGMYDRSLSPVSSVGLNTFIGAMTGAQTFDVQVQWDQQAGRWLYVSLEMYNNFANNFIAFGWSKAGDLNTLTLANSDWCNFHIGTSTDLHDFPKLGHDATFMLIGTNVFAGTTFTTSAIWAITKPAPSDATCTPPTMKQFGTAAKPLLHLAPIATTRIFTPVPGNTTDSGATAYISAVELGVIGILHVSPIAFGGCTTPPCLVSDGEIPITPWNPGTGFQVPQPAPNQNLDAMDGRLTQGVQHVDPRAGGAEAVWTQHTVQGAGGRTVVTWFELIPSACAGGACPASAKRQEGTLSDPNLYLFNAAISPTSNGDAAIINYNTGSATSLNDVRAQSHDAADPLNAMSGKFTLRKSTVAETDFSCTMSGGPPCRWGDYAGASPDPTNCSSVWGSSMLSGDVASTGAPNWVTQNFALDEGHLRSAVSTSQYVLSGSDGQTWVDMDPSLLRLASSPCATGGTGLITANADLFTSTPGVNQDIAIFEDIDGVAGTAPLAWKESGGFNGTFSPNAAYVQAVTPPMTVGHDYVFRLKWKAHKATSGTIYAGAGPLPSAGYSPTRLTLEVLPAAPGSAVITTQPNNTGSDGMTWLPIPGTTVPLNPLVNSRVVLGGNADLWTDTVGMNQDIGVSLTGPGYPTVAGQPEAWKESGGFNGTFSPNAAFVQATASLTGGMGYTAQLVWKTSGRAPANSSIYVGAGPLPAGSLNFSPTSLTAVVLPSPNPFEAVVTTQNPLTNSDGATWSDMGIHVPVVATIGINAIVSANADLWTATAGYNQDIAVFVSDNSGPQQLLVWKESGGFNTYSPNAAFAETVFTLIGGHSYVFAIMWKTNRNSAGTGATIYAGAGPIAGQFSPTRLQVKEVT